MDAPTPQQILQRSRLLRERYEVAEGEEYSGDLTVAIEDAAALVATITGRAIGPVAGEEVPAGLVGTAIRAIAMFVERFDVTGEAESAEETASGRRLRSISAGPWSESYFAPGDLIVRGGVPQLDSNEQLAALLWALCTEEKRDEYLALFTGRTSPAVVIGEVDYRRAGGGYGYAPGISRWPGW